MAATYIIVQAGIGNQAGNNNKHKLKGSGNKVTFTGSSMLSIDKVLHELELRRFEKASLEEKLQLKDEIIELLKKKTKI